METRMETRSLDLDPEGGLKELVLRWFTETQAPLILHNGNFPDWFQGLAARKEAEDLLRDKALGCFLIRLSDKAIGYILSYRGQDRCRHFVITQSPGGEFVIAGDSQLFGSLAQLIEHYKLSPIEPFGEVLTSSCCQADTGELYDMVNTRGKSGVSVQALRTMWDQKKDNQGEAGKTQKFLQEPVPAQPPVLPPKTAPRKLTGTVSVDVTSLPQPANSEKEESNQILQCLYSRPDEPSSVMWIYEPGSPVPPVPKRGLPLGFILGGSLPETSHSSEGQTRGTPAPDPSSRGSPGGPGPGPGPGDLPGPRELNQVENRRRSLPQLDNSSMEEEEDESFTASIPPKRVTCVTYSLHTCSSTALGSRFQQQSPGEEPLKSNPLYQSSQAPGGPPARQGDVTYAEVPQEPAAPPDGTYEQIQDKGAEAPSNTYESLEDVKTKKKSTWGKNNMNWKKFLPDYKKK